MKKFRPTLICLVVTRANDDWLQRFCAKLKSQWKWAAILAEGFFGGIITIWNHKLGYVTPLVRSRFALHLVMTTGLNMNWIILAIYNSNSFQGQRRLWYELSGMNSLNLPWILMGDFNAVVSQEEHHGGAHYYYRRKALAFSDFIATNNLLDVNYVGSQYTWCNNQQGLARRWARLDRCLINPSWSNSFEACIVKHLPRFLSDHSPMLLSIIPRVANKKNLSVLKMTG